MDERVSPSSGGDTQGPIYLGDGVPESMSESQ